MKNDANLHARSPRGGRSGSFLPNSIRAISTYLRSVSANASNIASTVRSGVALPLPNGSLQEDERQREQVQWAGFDKLELDSGEIRYVLLLTYLNGFQIWDVEEAQNVRELVSRRDGPVAFLRLQPKPYTNESPDGGGPLAASRPLLLVVTGDVTATGNQSPGSFPGNYNAGGSGSPPAGTGPQLIPTLIRFYSLQSHTYVHVLRFRTGIHAVRCSPRVVVVALYSQIYCFDAASLQNTFSVLTYPTPLAGPGATNLGFGALAVGPRWLAYAANQPIAPITGRVSPQHLTPSPGVSPSTSPHNASLVAHYAKESSKHIAAGIVTLGDMGYKTLSRYYSELMPDGPNSPQTGSPSWKPASNGLGHNGWSASTPHEPPEYAGMVIVRDFVSKTILTQFRAHTSPLSALAFDPSGTLLVTASIYGHNLNVFRLTPSAVGSNISSSGFDNSMTHVHLYKLYRGMTNAVIQDISFSSDSQWLVVSSSRGTSHIYAISPFGGTVGPQTHSAIPVDGLTGPTHTPAPSFPWWSSAGPLKASPQPLPPPPQAVNLSVVSRIKNGVGGWRGTVTGAAAAATGRTNTNTGAVAAIFHDGGKHSLEADIVSGCLNEQLWVLSPSGHLIRYLLGPTGGIEPGYNNVTGVNSTASGGPNPSQDLRLLIEPVERWDVSRKANWVEREERVDSLAGPGLGYEEEAVFSAVSGQRGGSGSHSSGSGNASVGKEGMSVEEMQRWFMSNAEVQMHSQARPLPIWAKSKVYFHVMLPKESGVNGNSDVDSVGGEIEIEKILTRVVEVRRKDLVPVIERLNVFTKVQGSREVASESIPAVSGLHMQLFVDDGLQEDGNSGNFGGKHIHRTSSGSSFGSEGPPNLGTMNGFHHNYQDYPDISLGGNTPPAFDSPASYFQHPQQHGTGAPPPFERVPAQGALSSPKRRGDGKFESGFRLHPLSKATGDFEAHATVSSPLNFQRLSPRDDRPNSGFSAPSIGDDEEVRSVSGIDPSVEISGPPVEHGTQEALSRRLSGVQLSSDLHVETKEYRQESKVGAGNRGEGVIRGVNGEIMALYDHMSPEDLGTHESQDSPIPSDHQPWDMGLDNADMEPLIRLSPGGIVARDLDDRPEFLYGRTQEVDHVEAGMGHVQETGKVLEDAESTDALSKSEDNDGVYTGDDVWEGAMFPFCEEGKERLFLLLNGPLVTKDVVFSSGLCIVCCHLLTNS
ncbi:hypothetical protein R1sor_007073 [Riccia sorocarpa]|uniref:BCAS3 domain-containing protein n=1 Tax=Riccia sorocarpa TaxID=122646 RepID=A0ABD3HPB9_9MARC